MKNFLHVTYLSIVILFTSTNFTYGNKVDSLKNLVRNEEDIHIKIQLLNKLSIEILDFDKEEAIRYALGALNLAKLENYESGIIKAYTIMGYSYFFYNNYTKALENYFQAVRYLKKTSDYKLLADTYSNIAVIYNYLEDPVKSIRFTKLSLKILKKKPDTEILLNDYLNLARSYRLLKNNVEDLNYLKKAIAIRIQNNESDKLGIEFNRLGSAYLNMKNYDSALYYFNKYQLISSQTRDSLGAARAYNNLGATYCAKGEYLKAIAHLKNAKKLNQPNLSFTYIEFVHAYCKLNKLEKASYYFNLAKSKNENIKELTVAGDSLITGYEKRTYFKTANFYHHIVGGLRKKIILDADKNVELTLKPRFEAEGIEARLMEKENHALLVENFRLQRIQNYSLTIILILIVAVAFFIIYNFRIKILKQKAKIEKVKSIRGDFERLGQIIHTLGR